PEARAVLFQSDGDGPEGCTGSDPTLVTVLLVSAGTPVPPASLSDSEVEDVLRTVLAHERLASPGDGTVIEVLRERTSADIYPGYVAFGVSIDRPEEAATPVKGRFAVSRRTGDVWELSLCQRYSFSALRALQRQIGARTGARLGDETAQRRRLGCTDE